MCLQILDLVAVGLLGVEMWYIDFCYRDILEKDLLTS